MSSFQPDITQEDLKAARQMLQGDGTSSEPKTPLPPSALKAHMAGRRISVQPATTKPTTDGMETMNQAAPVRDDADQDLKPHELKRLFEADIARAQKSGFRYIKRNEGSGKRAITVHIFRKNNQPDIEIVTDRHNQPKQHAWERFQGAMAGTQQLGTQKGDPTISGSSDGNASSVVTPAQDASLNPTSSTTAGDTESADLIARKKALLLRLKALGYATHGVSRTGQEGSILVVSLPQSSFKPINILLDDDEAPSEEGLAMLAGLLEGPAASPAAVPVKPPTAPVSPPSPPTAAAVTTTAPEAVDRSRAEANGDSHSQAPANLAPPTAPAARAAAKPEISTLEEIIANPRRTFRGKLQQGRFERGWDFDEMARATTEAMIIKVEIKREQVQKWEFGILVPNEDEYKALVQVLIKDNDKVTDKIQTEEDFRRTYEAAHAAGVGSEERLALVTKIRNYRHDRPALLDDNQFAGEISKVKTYIELDPQEQIAADEGKLPQVLMAIERNEWNPSPGLMLAIGKALEFGEKELIALHEALTQEAESASHVEAVRVLAGKSTDLPDAVEQQRQQLQQLLRKPDGEVPSYTEMANAISTKSPEAVYKTHVPTGIGALTSKNRPKMSGFRAAALGDAVEEFIADYIAATTPADQVEEKQAAVSELLKAMGGWNRTPKKKPPYQTDVDLRVVLVVFFKATKPAATRNS